MKQIAEKQNTGRKDSPEFRVMDHACGQPHDGEDDIMLAASRRSQFNMAPLKIHTGGERYLRISPLPPGPQPPSSRR
jgi:hypothetical protein